MIYFRCGVCGEKLEGEELEPGTWRAILGIGHDHEGEHMTETETETTKGPTCGTCPAFEDRSERARGGANTNGRCRARPPLPNPAPVYAQWPIVNPQTDWCLEHPERKSSDARRTERVLDPAPAPGPAPAPADSGAPRAGGRRERKD